MSLFACSVATEIRICGKSFAWRRLNTPWLFPWR